MATVVQQPSSLVFSSVIDDVVFRSTADHAVIKVIITHSGSQSTILEETYHPDEGTIRLVDMPGLLESYARQFLSISVRVTIDDYNAAGTNTGSEHTDDFTVLFSAADVGETATAFTNAHFLTTLNGPKMTALGREERVYAYGASQVTVTAVVDNGSGVVTRTATLSAAATTNGVSAFFVSPDNVLTLLAGYQDTGRLVQYDITAGNRNQRFLVIDSEQPAPSLCFINSFGCLEFLHCVGTHQKDSKYSRLSARIGGLLRNYRVTEDRQFKANTGWLSRDMADWADELLRSQEVYVWLGNAIGKQVVITDSESVISNEDAFMPAFEFTYVYAQRIHNVMQRTHAGRIFDNTFDHTFN